MSQINIIYIKRKKNNKYKKAKKNVNRLRCRLITKDYIKLVFQCGKHFYTTCINIKLWYEPTCCAALCYFLYKRIWSTIYNRGWLDNIKAIKLHLLTSGCNCTCVPLLLRFAVSRMSTGGCSFPSHSCSSTSPHQPSLNLSIKSERSSPELMSSPTSPPLHHLRQHSPISNPDSAHHSPLETRSANGTKEFPKSGFPHDREEGGQPVRQLEMSDSWQR